MDEAQAGIKIPGRNINNLRYADDITLMAGSEEKLKGFLVGKALKSWMNNKAFIKLRSWHPVPLLQGK